MLSPNTQIKGYILRLGDASPRVQTLRVQRKRPGGLNRRILLGTPNRSGQEYTIPSRVLASVLYSYYILGFPCLGFPLKSFSCGYHGRQAKLERHEATMALTAHNPPQIERYMPRRTTRMHLSDSKRHWRCVFKNGCNVPV